MTLSVLKPASPLILLCAPALCAFALCVQGCGEKAPPPTEEAARPIKVMVVESSGSGAPRKFPGKVQASQRVDVAFRVSGPLTELPVKEGQEVQAGDVLARIDPRDFESRVASAQSALDSARAELKAMKAGERDENIRLLEAQLAAARAELDNAEKQFTRNKELLKAGVIAQRELDRYQTAREVAQAKFDSATQELARGKAGARAEDVESAESRIRGLEAQVRDAENALADTTLKAPFAGYVATLYAENHQEIQAKQPIVSIQDVSDVEVVVQVPETIVAQAVRDGRTEVLVTLPSVPGKQFEAAFKAFSTEADPKTQTYALTLTMPQPEGVNILPGMAAEAIARRTGASDASTASFLVPSSAVFADENAKQHMWVIDKTAMTAHRVDVQAGALSGDRIEVTGGLTTGDMIATSGVHYLREGMKVRVLGDETEGR